MGYLGFDEGDEVAVQHGLAQEAVGLGRLDADAQRRDDGGMGAQRQPHAELVQEAAQGRGGLGQLLQRQGGAWGAAWGSEPGPQQLRLHPRVSPTSLGVLPT